MESPDVWQAVLGECPEDREELDRRFAQRIRDLWAQE